MSDTTIDTDDLPPMSIPGRDTERDRRERTECPCGHDPEQPGTCILASQAPIAVTDSRADPCGRWYTATRANSSPVERERDAQIERAVERDGRPFDSIAIVASLKGDRWTVSIFGRAEFLIWLDVEARKRDTDPEDAAMLKRHAAWIRGLPRGVCPQIFDWGDKVQRGTIERGR